MDFGQCLQVRIAAPHESARNIAHGVRMASVFSRGMLLKPLFF
jgi:hypothetical protein